MATKWTEREKKHSNVHKSKRDFMARLRFARNELWVIWKKLVFFDSDTVFFVFFSFLPNVISFVFIQTLSSAKYKYRIWTWTRKLIYARLHPCEASSGKALCTCCVFFRVFMTTQLSDSISARDRCRMISSAGAYIHIGGETTSDNDRSTREWEKIWKFHNYYFSRWLDGHLLCFFLHLWLLLLTLVAAALAFFAYLSNSISHDSQMCNRLGSTMDVCAHKKKYNMKWKSADLTIETQIIIVQSKRLTTFNEFECAKHRSFRGIAKGDDDELESCHAYAIFHMCDLHKHSFESSSSSSGKRMASSACKESARRWSIESN